MFARNRQHRLEQLEPRQMMSATPLYFADGMSLVSQTPTSKSPVAESVSYLPPPADTHGSRATEVFEPTLLSDRDYDIYMNVPKLNSNPGAPITIHLDFTGHSLSSFANHRGQFPKQGMPIITPMYDTDFHEGPFSTKEIEEIRQIWARVAEDYAPFNVNVTTQYYGQLADGVALKVAIGGHPNDWYINWEEDTSTPSGTSSVNSFTDPSKPNVVFVFSDDIFNSTFTAEKDNDRRSINLIAAVANTASHEAGHAFGLDHLAKYVNGKKVDDYDGGDAEWTPIMGDNLASDRTTWAYGRKVDGAYQNDVQILASVLGLRADDHVSGRVGATSLVGSNNAIQPLTGKGIIEWQADTDFFKFTSNGGQVRVEVNAAQFGPNMWVNADLWSQTGFVASGQVGASNFQSIINAKIPAGTYYVIVRGNGGYGHLGQYSLKVSHLTGNAQTVGPVGGKVDPVGPLNPGKDTLPVAKTGKSTTVTKSGKSSSGDGNSNPVSYSVASTPSNLTTSSRSKTKHAVMPTELGLALKDAAFATL